MIIAKQTNTSVIICYNIVDDDSCGVVSKNNTTSNVLWHPERFLVVLFKTLISRRIIPIPSANIVQKKREEKKNLTNTFIINIGLTFYSIIDRSAQDRRPTGIHTVGYE